MSEYTPITGELRAAMCEWGWVERDGSITFTTSPIPTSIDAEQSLVISGSDFDRLCDAIDAIHAGLERENAALKAELDRVLGEQDEHTHTRGGSITGELREWAEQRKIHLFDMQLKAIADRIDAEHERECKEQYACGAEHGIGASIDASMIQTHGYVELPKDADGEPIHVGDVMDKGNVTCIRDCGKGWEIVLNSLYTYDAPSLHHHAPTVEDVLREFALAVCKDDALTIRSGVVEEFAKRLQLAGDAE